MPTYRVETIETVDYVRVYQVEAEDADEAWEMVEEGEGDEISSKDVSGSMQVMKVTEQTSRGYWDTHSYTCVVEGN